MSNQQDIIANCTKCGKPILNTETIYGTECLVCNQKRIKTAAQQNEAVANKKPPLKYLDEPCKTCKRQIPDTETTYSAECTQCWQKRIRRDNPAIDIGTVPYAITKTDLEFGITTNSVIMKFEFSVEGDPHALCQQLERNKKNLMQEIRTMTG